MDKAWNIAIKSVPLQSESGIDYRPMQALLMCGQWSDADTETFKIIRKVTHQCEFQGWMAADTLKSVPCIDLWTIEQLWIQSSKGRFGFSVQHQIWKEVGSITSHDSADWEEFGDRVGWRIDGKWTNLMSLKKDLLIAPKGQFPAKLWCHATPPKGVMRLCDAFPFLGPKLIECGF